jgi:hypothetical protein
MMECLLQLKLTHIKRCYKINEHINKVVGKPVIRNENFPCELSENLVMWALNELKLYPEPVVWNKLHGVKGDLSTGNTMIEVKCVNSGPTSYGPTEKWDEIYFLDTADFMKDIYMLYRVKLSNDAPEWARLKFSKKETFQEQCIRKIRPRQYFMDTLKQIHPLHTDTYMFQYDASKNKIFIL